MLKFFFLVFKKCSLVQKMLKLANYVWIYTENSIFLLDLAAILKKGRHFELRVANGLLLKYILMSECVSGIFWCFFKQDYLLYSPRRRLMEMFLLGTQNTPYALAKNYCILELNCYFPSGSMFCLLRGGVSSNVSFEHTEHTLWRKISAYWSRIAIFPAEVCFVCLKWGVASRHFL